MIKQNDWNKTVTVNYSQSFFCCDKKLVTTDLSPSSSSMAVKHGPCLLTEKKDPGFGNKVHEETSPHLLLTATSSGNCQETETCVVQACHTPRQPLQNYSPGHLGGLAMSWSVEEMLDGRHQRVDIPARARTAHKGLLLKRLEEGLCWIVPHVSLTTQPIKGLNWTELSLLNWSVNNNNGLHRKTEITEFLASNCPPPRRYFFMQTALFFGVGEWGRILDFML